MEGNYDDEDTKEIGEAHEPLLPPRPAHYYGDTVRQMLFAIGVIMLVGMPIFSNQINFRVAFLMLGILCVNLFAGLTNPRQRTTIFIDLMLSILGLLCFELFAFFEYRTFQNIGDLYFWFNQTIAILFFVSSYFSVKTLRGMLISPIR